MLKFLLPKRLPLCLLILALSLGCRNSATTQAATDTNHRIEALLRAEMGMPDDVVVEFGERKPSKDFPGWDSMVITYVSAGGQHRSSYDYLISKDNKEIFQLHKYDLDVHSLAKTMDQIDIDGRPFRGGSDAKVVIVNYDDLECPFCAMLHKSLFPGTLKHYGDKIKIVYKDFPLVSIHPWAMHAAIDAGCLARQSGDAYWSFTDAVHGHLRDIVGAPDHPRPIPDQQADVDKLAVAQAQQAKLNIDNFQACIAKGDHSAIDAEMQEAQALGVSSTPTMFINGIRVGGSMSEQNLEKIIDVALEDAGETPPPSGSAGQ